MIEFESMAERMLAAYIFGGLLIALIVVGVVMLAINVRQGRSYRDESLPSLLEMNLASDDDIEEEVILTIEKSAFDFDDYETNKIGDTDSEVMLRETTIATRAVVRVENRKRRLFGRKS